MQFNDQKKGMFMAFTVVMLITPDSLFIRLASISSWNLIFYRGFIPFSVVFVGLLSIYKFKFILSDPSIVYGTNINLTLIDIEKSMKDISTRNTLYQLIGRAGRKGKSTNASVIFRSWKLFDIIINSNDNNFEAEQIEKNILLI